MGLFKKFVSQTRKPEGFLGKVMLSGMNSGHAAMADWGFSHLPPIQPEKAVDLCCGGGRNAAVLLKKYPKAHMTAIDYSDLSVEKAKAFNQAAIAAGRCKVRQGDVSDLHLPDSSFDLATAFETVYFWPGLERCFTQVARILKPGGIFIPSVTMILSGMSNQEQLEKNLATFSENKKLNDVEMKALMSVADRMLSVGTVPCTACHYCVSHCPQGLDIPHLIALYNEHAYTGGGFIAPMALSALPEDKRPQACLACRNCEQICPQQIKISEVMADFSAKLG